MVTMFEVDTQASILYGQFRAMLADIAENMSAMEKAAGRDGEETAYIRGKYAGYQRVYDDLLSLFHGFCGFVRLLEPQQQTDSIQNSVRWLEYTTAEPSEQGSVEA